MLISFFGYCCLIAFAWACSSARRRINFFSSIAILLGGLGGLVPERRSEIARLGLKAVLAGTLANLSSAAIAGMLIQ